MSDIAIRVEGISKRYKIGATQESYKTVRDTISHAFGAPLRMFKKKEKKEERTFWALKDVTFDVKQGEVIGVIGPNGAGKSTLLKVLARITDPTEGMAEIHGRVGSLLEVGTGFHLELTGRENIFLNGAILGMRRTEIESKFEEMVEFAEVGKFIDTPVKHYSSGMYLRLAFSVAAHLEPEILLVDEVLAVGDMNFQKKCLNKMEDVASKGRTVLFVSHNLGAIRELCTTSVVLKNGVVDFHGPVTEGLVRYNRALTNTEAVDASNSDGWRNLGVNGQLSGVAASVPNDSPFEIESVLQVSDTFKGGRIFCIIHNSLSEMVVHRRVELEEVTDGVLCPGRHKVKAKFPALWLAPGVYSMHFKFIGTRPSGTDEKMTSERAMLDISGDGYAIGRASLAPDVTWSLEDTSRVPTPSLSGSA